MKHFVLILCFINIVVNCIAQPKPKFTEIVNEYFTRYSYESYETYIKFQKRKEGWYIVEDSLAHPAQYFNKQLFWSEQDKAYLNLNFYSASGDTSLASERITRYHKLIDWEYEEAQYSKHKYYGYPGWDWDIINEPINPAIITDSGWESLARANSNYASGFIVEQYGDIFLNNDNDRRPLKPSETISKERAKKFILYESKAIDAYQKILNHNPRYETKVGKIQIKAANEYMFMYLDLLIGGDSISAKQCAVKANYPDSLLNLSKLYLASLPLNSILITGGDNDTYPLLYLQEIKNYRKDVLVLNYNLLGLRQFLLFVDKKHKKTLFSTVDTNYMKINFDYFVYSNNTGTDSVIGSKEFIDKLTRNENPYDSTITLYQGEKLRKYYSNELAFSNNVTHDTLIFKSIKLNTYMYLNDFIVIDILNTNVDKRKVFSSFLINLFSKVSVYNEPLYEINAFAN